MPNHRLIKALKQQPVDKTPIWIMRQAGRYLPEYKAAREKAGSFLNLCKTPELACEVTLQPLARFDLDAAILFSDILTIPDAMGLELYFTEGEGPKFKKILQSSQDIKALNVPDVAKDLRYVTDAVKIIKHELDNKVPLIGFSGSPWTLATYMIEGGSSKQFEKIKSLLFQDAKTLHLLLDKLAKSVTDYLNAQIHAGVDVVMIFDTWGGILSTHDYREFSLNYMKKILASLPKEIPSIIFTKGGSLWLNEMADSGASCLGLDWTIDIDKAREIVGTRVALQGNLDPAVLYAQPEVIRQHAKEILQKAGKTGHIFNLGHGIHQHISPENVKVLVDVVHED